jgi:hypothetical protein
MVERRRVGSARIRWGGFAAAAAFLLAMTASAEAQGFFDIFRPGPSPYDIERRLEDAGYVLQRPLVLRGDVYLADVEAGRGRFQRLVIEADSGRILERFRAARDVDPDFGVADPWGASPYARGRFADRDDRDLSMAMPPGRDAPPSLYLSPEPSDASKVKAKPKPADAKRGVAAPEAKAVNPPPAVAPAPTSAAPTPSPAAAAPAPAPAAAGPTPSQLAKTDAAAAGPAAAGPAAPKPAPAAETPAKKKAVNDLPVTPLD